MPFAQLLLPGQLTRTWLSTQAQSWLWVLLATASYLLTITYASHSEAVCSVPAIGDSETSALRALSFLVVLNAFFLGATIRTAFGKMQSWLIAGPGLSGVGYLALQPSTSALGHLKIIHWHDERKDSARVWSALQLIVTAALPLSTFLILGK
jgi:hypothetical protein